MAISACSKMTRANVKRAAFFSITQCPFTLRLTTCMHIHFCRVIFEHNYCNHGNESILRKVSKKLFFFSLLKVL